MSRNAPTMFFLISSTALQNLNELWKIKHHRERATNKVKKNPVSRIAPVYPNNDGYFLSHLFASSSLHTPIYMYFLLNKLLLLIFKRVYKKKKENSRNFDIV